MANVKITQLSELGDGVASAGLTIPVVDTNDTTQAASGTTKKMTVESLAKTVARDAQGYLGLLSAVYFSGSATSSDPVLLMKDQQQ